MWQSKRFLLKRISELERELEKEMYHNRRSALVEKADLPQCESIACAGCARAVYQNVPGLGYILLGCGKDLVCPCFEESQNKPSISEQVQLLTKEACNCNQSCDCVWNPKSP